MLDVFSDCEQGKFVRTQTSGGGKTMQFHGGLVSTGDEIELKNVPVVTPNGDTLVCCCSIH